jgi:4-diphosphocytidyl-2C-methyl-D-erythritol kinase
MRRLTSSGSDDRVEAFVAAAKDGKSTAPPWHELENDLEPVVIEGWPETGRALDALRGQGPLHAAISGSGASSYAVYQDSEAARVAAEGLKDIGNIHVTSTVGRARGRPTAMHCENWEESA